MTINKEIITIIYASPLANDAMLVVVLLCIIVSFFMYTEVARKLLMISCAVALSMLLYDYLYSYFKVLSSGGSVPFPIFALLIWIVFSPTSLIIAAALGNITSTRRIRLWSSVVFVSAVASWFGLASLHYMGGAQ